MSASRAQREAVEAFLLRELQRGTKATRTQATLNTSDDAAAIERAAEAAVERKIRLLMQGYWSRVYKRPPLITLALAIACIAQHFAAGEGNVPGPTARSMMYVPGADFSGRPLYEWYRPLSAMFSHVSDEHLWMNMLMLGISGCIFEYTEGFWNTINVVWAAGTLGFALHGVVRSNVAVRGLSGAIYGLIAAQIALLGLNWSEMPFRWPRFLILSILIGSDVYIYLSAPTAGVSFSAHLGGAVAGVCVALVMGKNVRLRRWELTMTWIGVAGYVAFVFLALSRDQIAGGVLGAAALPALVAYAIMITWKMKLCCGGERRSCLLFWCGGVDPLTDIDGEAIAV